MFWANKIEQIDIPLKDLPFSQHLNMIRPVFTQKCLCFAPGLVFMHLLIDTPTPPLPPPPRDIVGQCGEFYGI